MAEDTVDVVVEIPKGSRNKYEFDPEHGCMRLDRCLLSANTFPADYRYVPDTAGPGGDALDALSGAWGCAGRLTKSG